jgi:phage/plasmid-like protein (TIGR03299 family)
MSAETMEDLNTWTLIGYGDVRGTAWHYRADLQGAEPNHYPGAIPVDDVKRRLFYWKPSIGTVKITAKVNGRSRTTVDETKKAYVHPETGKILGIAGKGHAGHYYDEWLVRNTRGLQEVPEMGIASAGLLSGGAIAWLQLELADTVLGPGGVAFRPFYTATTVFDSSMATTYLRGDQLVVCDNTRAAALSAAGDQDKIKVAHRASSLDKEFISDLRKQVTALYVQADQTKAAIETLLATPVSDSQWESFMEIHLGGRPDAKGRKLTNWEEAHDKQTALFRTDERCAPTGTAWAALQAVSTFNHHDRVVRRMSRAQRNMANMTDGTWTREDEKAMAELGVALGAPVLLAA